MPRPVRQSRDRFALTLVLPFYVLACCLGLFLLYRTLVPALCTVWSLSWPSTSGVVTKSTVKEEAGWISTARAHIEYRYRVDGSGNLQDSKPRSFRARRISFAYDFAPFLFDGREYVERYKKGAAVVIRHSRGRPWVACLERGWPVAALLFWCYLFVFALFVTYGSLRRLAGAVAPLCWPEEARFYDELADWCRGGEVLCQRDEDDFWGRHHYALLTALGPIDLAVTGNSKDTMTLCLLHAPVLSPGAMKTLLLADELVVEALAPYRAFTSRLLSVSAGRVLVTLPVPTAHSSHRPAALARLMEAVATAIGKKAPIPDRRCVSCRAADSRLVLAPIGPLRFCQVCQQQGSISHPLLGQVEPNYPLELLLYPHGDDRRRRFDGETSIVRLEERLAAARAAYRQWLRSGTIASFALTSLLLASGLLLLLVSSSNSPRTYMTLSCLLLTALAPGLHLRFFIQATADLDKSESLPVVPTGALPVADNEALASWLHARTTAWQLDCPAAVQVAPCSGLATTIAGSNTLVAQVGAMSMLLLGQEDIEGLIRHSLRRAELGRQVDEGPYMAVATCLFAAVEHAQGMTTNAWSRALLSPLRHQLLTVTCEYLALLRAFQRRLELAADSAAAKSEGAATIAALLSREACTTALVDTAVARWRRESAAAGLPDGPPGTVQFIDGCLAAMQSLAAEDLTEPWRCLCAAEPLWTDRRPALAARLLNLGQQVEQPGPPQLAPKAATIPGLDDLVEDCLDWVSEAFAESFSYSARIYRHSRQWRDEIAAAAPAGQELPSQLLLRAEASGWLCQYDAVATALEEVVTAQPDNSVARGRLIAALLLRHRRDDVRRHVAAFFAAAAEGAELDWLTLVVPMRWEELTVLERSTALYCLSEELVAVLQEQGRPSLLPACYTALQGTGWNGTARSNAFLERKKCSPSPIR